MTQAAIEGWRAIAMVKCGTKDLVEYNEVGKVCIVQTHMRDPKLITRESPEHYETIILGDRFDGWVKRHSSQLAATNYHRLSLNKCTEFRSDIPWPKDKEYPNEQPSTW